MKVTYNWLKDFVEIKISPKALAEKLTMAGLEVASLEEKGQDFVFEIEVTSNRPDWLSVMGIARELAAITNTKLRAYSLERRAYSKKVDAKHYPLNAKNSYPLLIRIEDKKDCPLYTAKIIKDVKVRPSPAWLKNRLELLGCRSVNNVVDITNYILFEQGEPLHAFDLDKLVLKFSSSQVLSLRIIIRRAKKGEEITTIDGIKRVLNEEILVIASEVSELKNLRTKELTNRPVAVAGVMCSKDTEVTETTKNILLEAAAFNPIIVRRGRRSLGIQSESSYRFERGVNLEIVDNVSWRAAQFIQELAGGSCVLAKRSELTKTKRKRKSITLELSAVNKTLGINIPAPKIKKILNSLEFKTNPVRNTKSSRKKLKISNGAKIKTKNHFAVEIPAHRSDVTQDVDLIEEIARIYGYEKVPQTLPTLKPQVCVGETRDLPCSSFKEDIIVEEGRGLVSLIKSILVGLGLNEVITYSLMGKDLLRDCGMEQGSIEILNPLSKEQEILRPRLIPGLAACTAYNLNQKYDYINIFEVAKVFSPSIALVQEELRLGIALCGIKSLLFEQGLIKDSVGFLHLKGILEVLFERLGVREYNFNIEDNAFRIAVYVAGQNLGLMAKLEKSVLDKLDIKNKDVFVLELSLDRLLLFINLNKKFSHLPIYPGIFRDISLILKDEILVGDILEAIRKEGRPLLREARVADYYKGKQIPPGFKGLTLSCLYRSDERTLTEAEIKPVHSRICNLLTERFRAQVRSCPPTPSTKQNDGKASQDCAKSL